MKKLFKLAILSTAVLSMVACTRVPTGTTGVRVNLSKEIQRGELAPGTWNQTLIGDVLLFPVKDIAVNLDNKTPMTIDNSALQDFDVTAVYSLNPQSVADLYAVKSHSFHTQDKDGEIYLMYNYMMTLLNNAMYKAVRKYKNLEVADNRQIIEKEILEKVNDELRAEKLDTAITVSVIQIRNILPNQDIMKSSTELVRSQNELKIKENEVRAAELESRRMQALSQNSAQSIAYMQAQAISAIAEGVKNGKVQTIVVPVDFKGMINVGSSK